MKCGCVIDKYDIKYSVVAFMGQNKNPTRVRWIAVYSKERGT